jgi:hypothetical protein
MTDAVFSTDAAFAVLRAAGEVFCWGDALYGGCCGDVKVRQHIVSGCLGTFSFKTHRYQV